MRKTHPVRVTLLALVTASLMTAGCGDDSPASSATAGTGSGPSPYPVTVASCGNSFTYEQPPERVVAGFPTSTETLVALGVGDTVVGYTSGDIAPAPEGVPNAEEISGDYQAPREAVLAARPDLFFTNDENQLGGTGGGLSHDDLNDMGTSAYVLGGYCIDQPAATGIDAVYDDVTNLGAIFGVPDRAEAVVTEMRSRVDAAGALADSEPGLTAAFVQVYDGKLYALSGAYYGMVLDSLGLDNVLAGIDENFAEISAEQVLTLDPDVLLAVYDSQDTMTAQLDEASQLLANTPAVSDDRVAGVLNADISAGGVTLVDVIEETARAVYG
jgi:iron complex transport system substrate-binding protein